MMSLYKTLSVATLGLVVTLPLLNNLSATAEMPQAIKLIAQAAQKPKVILNLAVAKKAIKATVEGKEQVQWQELEDGVSVVPGDVLRYTINGQNTGKTPAQDLEVTQPIPDLMVYKLDSATSKDAAEITYSVDRGETFVANPIIKITQEDGTVVERPAPAEAYTHIRWNFAAVTPETGAKAMFKVKVQ